MKKNGLLKLYISFTIKQTEFQITVTFYSTIYIIRAIYIISPYSVYVASVVSNFHVL